MSDAVWLRVLTMDRETIARVLSTLGETEARAFLAVARAQSADWKTLDTIRRRVRSQSATRRLRAKRERAKLMKEIS